VYHLELLSDPAVSVRGWNAYRAHRIPAL
jgi:hypothetical protein